MESHANPDSHHPAGSAAAELIACRPRDQRGHCMTDRLTIDYYTDLLCVWAWIAQRRIDALESEWGDRVRLTHHCVDVFGDTAGKMERQWHDRGGYAGFAEHVQQAASSYEDARVHPALWRDVRPTTSATAHLVLKATALTDGETQMVALAGHLRRAFFVDGRDIGRLEVVLELAADLGIDRAGIEARLASGEALAALLADYDLAGQRGIRGSPSWVMNEGRQVLYGNVGYRILQANVEELLRHPEQEASWC